MRRALSIVSLLACAGLLAGCGGGPGNPVTAAVAKSEQAGGAKVTLTATFVVPTGDTYAMTGRGAFGPQGGEMTYAISDFLRLAPTLGGSATTLKAIYVESPAGPVVYSSFPFITGRLPAGKHWMKLDVAKALRAFPYETLLAVGNTLQSPSDLIDLLRAATAPAKLGTGYYATTVQLDHTQKLGVGPQTMAGIMTNQGALTDGQTHVWIAPDGFLRKVEIEYDTATTDQVQSELTVTLDLSGWGTPVTVTPPPAGQVVDDTQAVLSGVSFERPAHK